MGNETIADRQKRKIPQEAGSGTGSYRAVGSMDVVRVLGYCCAPPKVRDAQQNNADGVSEDESAVDSASIVLAFKDGYHHVEGTTYRYTPPYSIQRMHHLLLLSSQLDFDHHGLCLD